MKKGIVAIFTSDNEVKSLERSVLGKLISDLDPVSLAIAATNLCCEEEANLRKAINDAFLDNPSLAAAMRTMNVRFGSLAV